jgi:VCBS repeat-containing protein
MDGIAVAQSSSTAPPFIFANRNDGTITKLDLTQTPPVTSDIFVGGTRGDFVAVGPDGCLYAAQTSSIVRVTNADGTCSLAGTSVVPQLGLAPAHADLFRGATQSVTATVTNVASPSGIQVHFAVTGANPQTGVATADSSGHATFSYIGASTGDDSIVATASAGSVALTSNPATVTWGNRAPVADDQSLGANSGSPTPVTLSAADPDGDALTYSIVAQPAHGTLSGTAPGLTYTSSAGFAGVDSFTFRASDGIADSNIATVTVNVASANHAPVAQDQSVSTDEGVAVPVSLVATDTDGDSLAYTVVTSPSHGSLSGSGRDLTYTPAAGFSGNDSFTFHANDGQADSNTATVSVHVRAVNHAPVCAARSASTAEDVVLEARLACSDTDAVQTIAYRLVGGATHGTVVVGADGSFRYTPARDYNGSDSFTFAANDGLADSNVATVSLDVTPVNDAPTAGDASVGLTESDPPVTIDLGVLASDLETPAAGLGFAVVTGPSKGSLTVSGSTGQYQPSPGASGDDSFTYRVTDGGDPDGCGTAGLHCSAALSTVGTIHIHIAARNHAPTVSLDPAGPVAEGAVPVTLVAHAEDPDGGMLTFTWTTDAGTVISHGDTASFSADDGPAQAHVSVTVSDSVLTGSARQTIVVNNVAPTVDAGPDRTAYWGLPVAFHGTSTDVSHADTAAGLNPTWTFERPGGTDVRAGTDVLETYDAPGSYAARLDAADKDGGRGSDVASVTIQRRPTALQYTGSTNAVFGFATLSARLTDNVDTPTARLAGRVIRFTLGQRTFEGTTNAQGIVTITPLLPLTGGAVSVTFAGDTLYLSSAATARLVVGSSVAKITGGGLRSVGGGSGGFNAQAAGSLVKGELQFQNGSLNYHAHELTALGISADGKTGWFAGVGVDGRDFVAYVEDNGEPGTHDVFRLWVGGVQQAGDGRLTGGNIQIHKGP